MVDDHGKRCALCGGCKRPFVKAHIIAEGLLSLNRETGHRLACIDVSGRFARRLDGLYLNRITCRECEEKVFTPLDNYAIQIFRNKKGCELVEENEAARICRVNEGCRQTLRAYFASLAYRFSLAREGLFEAGNVILGGWHSKIKSDLLNWENSKFDYIDALCIEVCSPDADSFRAPRKMIVGGDALGFLVDIPHWRFFVSIGCQHHPYVAQLFNDGHVSAPLYSLSSAFDEFPYCCHSVDFMPDRFNALLDCIMAYNQKAKIGREVHIR